ncbi:MAG: hypothetical protein M3512_04505 [Bacteroidota bacterium]|nr:hypothetical protein [Bacteroidota bacterium]
MKCCNLLSSSWRWQNQATLMGKDFRNGQLQAAAKKNEGKAMYIDVDPKAKPGPNTNRFQHLEKAKIDLKSKRWFNSGS